MSGNTKNDNFSIKCSVCGESYLDDDMEILQNGNWYCPGCLEEHENTI